jgi:hypothetical protein
MTFLSILALLTTSLVTTAAHADTWDTYNDPSHFGNYVYNFNALPLAASLAVDQRPWSESYWPRNKGSINLRWNSPTHEGFDYVSPSKGEVLSRSRDQLAQLSPAEKYDLARGLYDYPLTKHVAAVNAYRNAKDYEGICDGWTATAIQFREPKPVDITNPDGIVIPFGSSDVKALMSYHAAFNVDLGPVLIGRYCTVLGGARCADINPGAYHVILANEIGLKNQAFAADVEIGKETWNQPIYGFEFEVKGSAYSHAPKALLIHAKMHYTDELDQSQWLPVTGTDKFVGTIQETEYILEMDANDNIIGGSWITTGVHPDLFWKPTNKITFTGDFEFLNKIYQPM